MKEDRRAVARERHSLFRSGAFAAARMRRPSIQNIRERYSDHVPPGPNTWTLNIQPLGRFRPHRGFLLARFTLPSSVARLLHTHSANCTVYPLILSPAPAGLFFDTAPTEPPGVWL